MENNNWNNRNRRNDYHYGDRDIDRNRRVDEDSYRGAYRLGTESDHHNVSTYNGFEEYNRQQDNRDEERNHGGDYVYRRSRDREDNPRENRGYNESGNQQQYRRDNDWNQNQSDRNHNYSGNNHRTTFNDEYPPDNYRHRDGENYGKMAGSLSFGYDGDRNADPDYNRNYDPLSGRMRNSNRDNNRGSQNQQRRYGPPDEYGFNPDYDRY